ncbi:uncharacterized protein Z518_06613 [Rhinocladiella mackenziei CBS 650.93]|uniref:Uncharacterized protein n=1 Tax=Rhinocladiella mackenziei CBS 650.93 TaxID=1442369 RepID=A0A0D2GY01_9EURO|nr:uncharacterized protein Z518_06613 [Rhinocladiella mackenziei CBS 650.93]KIX03063.1 hypothetical protein Z518_06613 [Rhinocladiella mackenziei CBS 650.93]
MPVLIAFMVTSLTALIALSIGLVTDSIPLNLTNNVDDHVRDALRGVYLTLRKVLRIHGRSLAQDHEHRLDRIKVLESFMISVSDQILVSEIAILVAAFSRSSDLSIYSANMVTSLALLASSVHLATLPVIKDYSQSNIVITTAKIVLMMLACLSLVTLLIFQASATWYQHAYFKCGVRALRVPSDALTGIDAYLFPLLVLYAHYEAIRYFVLPRRDTPPAPSTNSQATTRSNSNGAKSTHETEQCSIKTYKEFSSSKYASVLCGGTSKGFSQNVISVRSHADGMAGDPNEWGFGQIVPLVLLLLPVLTATQHLLDYRGLLKRSKKGPNTQGSVSPPQSEPSPSNSDAPTDRSHPTSVLEAQEVKDPDMRKNSATTASTSTLQASDPHSTAQGIVMPQNPSLPSEGGLSPPLTAQREPPEPAKRSIATKNWLQTADVLERWAMSDQSPLDENYPHRVDAISWTPVRLWVWWYLILMGPFAIIYGVALTGIFGSSVSLGFNITWAVIISRVSIGNWLLNRFSKQHHHFRYDEEQPNPATVITTTNAIRGDNEAHADHEAPPVGGD